MSRHRIGVMDGDGIGPEIVPEAVRVVQAAASMKEDLDIEWVHLPVGYASLLERGETLPESTLSGLAGLDGWILGPIGHMDYPKDKPRAVNPHPIIRKRFSLHSNIRPARSHPSISSIHEDVDLVIVRENNEGFQPDRNVFAGSGEFMPSPDMVVSVRVISRGNSEFVARTAFELARERGARRRVTIVHKNTVFKLGCGLFVDCCREVSSDYPEIQCDEVVVDTFAMRLAMAPQEFDVIVTTNMFGDILSDEAAGLVGGLGMAPGLCVGPKYAMAQATHGSAPDIAGRGIANPYAMVVSAAMLMSWLGKRAGDPSVIEVGDVISRAMDAVLADGQHVTPDLGGSAGSTEMADAVIDQVRRVEA